MPRKAATKKTKSHKGTGYGGIGYASEVDLVTSDYVGEPAHDHKDMAEIESDDKLKQTIKMLLSLLPTSEDRLASTILPELVLFRLSIFFNRFAALVRNDSIVNMSERQELYHAIFTFIHRVSEIVGLSQLLTEPRYSSGSPGLEVLKEGHGEYAFIKDTSASIHVSLSMLLRDLNCKILLYQIL
jgi:hypothetical protein